MKWLANDLDCWRRSRRRKTFVRADEKLTAEEFSSLGSSASSRPAIAESIGGAAADSFQVLRKNLV
jgi:hypothetical protein